MKVGYVATSISRQAGGLFFSVRSLAQAFSRESDAKVEVYGLADQHSHDDLPQWTPLKPMVLPVSGPPSLGFSLALDSALHANCCDLLHSQGIWQGLSWSVHRWHRRQRRPYLISPRGMLDPWALANSRWKKQIASLLYENRHLRNAACLHALCASEARSIRAYGLKKPICVIPNGVETPPASPIAASSTVGVKRILYLGRLHPKKGLINAIRAWKSVCESANSANWQFVVAGWDQGGHEKELQQLATDLGVRWGKVVEGEERTLFNSPFEEFSVIFSGPVFGDEKSRLLRHASAFILPSYSEGLPMAVLEAWAHQLPVLMTSYCNLPEGFGVGAAIQVGVDADSIAEGLRHVMEMSDLERQGIGANGVKLVQDRFTWPKIATQMRGVYEWVLGGGVRPDSMLN